MGEEKQNLQKADALFVGFHQGKRRQYPAWRYHKALDPILVANTEDDKKAKERGYDEASPPIMANHQLHNWYWDLEDMSARQLCFFAKDEFGVDFPPEAGQERLLKAVLILARNAPQNRDRIIFMAHTIRMNYEETLETIRKMAEGAAETERMEFVA